MIYLDNSATTRPFDAAIEAMVRAMREGYFNPSAAYAPAMAVERETQACRALVAAELSAKPEEVIFTSGGTESDVLALLGVAETLKKPANFAVSALEHPAVAESVRRVERMGHEVRVLPVDARGVVDLARAEEMIDAHTALVSCMHVSNETGAIQPVSALSRLAKAKNPAALMHVDGVQAFLRVPLNMARAGVDLYSLSAHKVHGPKGVGALVARGGVRLAPQQTGGGQERGLRSGTTDAPAILGFGAAIREMRARPDRASSLAALKARLWENLRGEAGAFVNGPAPGEADAAPHIVSLSFEGVRGEVLRNALEAEGVLVSTGSACASHKQKVSPVLRAMGLTTERADGTIRVSLGLFNEAREMDEAAEKMLRLAAELRKYRRR